jgi:hypothetical protein
MPATIPSPPVAETKRAVAPRKAYLHGLQPKPRGEGAEKAKKPVMKWSEGESVRWAIKIGGDTS